MADEKPPPPGRTGLAGYVQQGQILLALAVAGAGLLFNIGANRREELAVNRAAVEAARGETLRADFREDPHNTLAEFKATYPRHAYCAALGFFIAENGRLSRTMLDRPDEQVRSMNDALTIEVEALAESLGIGPEAFAAFRDAAAARAGAADAGAGCATVHAGRSPWAPFSDPECRLALDSFGQNRCMIQRWSDQRAAAVRAEQAAVAAIPYPELAPPPPPPPPAGTAAPADEPAPSRFPAPDACGAAPPLVLVQHARPEDAAAVDALRMRMLWAGWQVAPAEPRPAARTEGDVRIYSEDQRPCAEALAAAVGSDPAVARPISVISLAGRYAGLPQGQIELWLPELAHAR
jgi:hypothetical protein